MKLPANAPDFVPTTHSTENQSCSSRLSFYVHEMFCSFKSPSKGGGSLSLLTGDGHKLVLHYRPFRIDVYAGKDDLVVSLNSQQLMKIEHFRTRLVLVSYSSA
jgi:hypothetical protein